MLIFLVLLLVIVRLIRFYHLAAFSQLCDLARGGILLRGVKFDKFLVHVVHIQFKQELDISAFFFIIVILIVMVVSL